MFTIASIGLCWTSLIRSTPSSDVCLNLHPPLFSSNASFVFTEWVQPLGDSAYWMPFWPSSWDRLGLDTEPSQGQVAPQNEFGPCGERWHPLQSVKRGGHKEMLSVGLGSSGKRRGWKRVGSVCVWMRRMGCPSFLWLWMDPIAVF